MKTIQAILVGIVLSASTTSFAHGPKPHFPLYIYCMQTTERVNGWIRHHLFAFQKEESSKGRYIGGIYHRADSHENDASIWHNVTNSQGKAALSGSENPRGGFYTLNSIGYNTQADGYLPTYAVTIRVDVNPGGKSEAMDITDRGTGFLPEEYQATCKSVTEDEAKKAMRLQKLFK